MNKKIRMFLMGFLICITGIFGMGNVNAEVKTVTWSDIQSSFQKVLGNVYNVSTNSNSVTVSVNNEDYSVTFLDDYSITFNYEDNKITYTTTRTVTLPAGVNPEDMGMTEAELLADLKDAYYYMDSFMIDEVIDVLRDAYQISGDINLGDDLSQYGINIVTDDTAKTVSLTLDVTTFANETCTYHDTLINQNTYVLTTYETPDTPKTENPKCKVSNGKYYDANGKEVSKEAYNKSCNSAVNPKTGLSLPVAGGIVVIILAGATYLVLNKKNKFRHI